LISNSDSFTDVLVQEVERSNWEQDWKTNTVHHCDPNDVDNSRALEMNNVVDTRVKLLVLCH
jgi:hypothetical protein